MTKKRDLHRELERAGFMLLAHRKGPHDKFFKPGMRPIAVPRHNEIDEHTADAIRKQAGLR